MSKILWGQCALIMVLGHSVGFVQVAKEDLDKTDKIACEVLEKLKLDAPKEIQQQMADNIRWIKSANDNQLVVGSQARILYADSIGRIEIAKAFNDAIKKNYWTNNIRQRPP